MPIWECNKCGRDVESELEPEECPCGSKDIIEKPKKSKLEHLIQRIF